MDIFCADPYCDLRFGGYPPDNFVPIDQEISWTDCPQKDPLTLHSCTLKNDFMLFLVYEISPFPIPLKIPKRKRTTFRKLKVIEDLPADLENLETVPAELSECFLFGLPGSISQEVFQKSCPHASKLSLFDAMQAMHRRNIILVSRGNIIQVGELLAASNTCSFGMSGGPLCIIRNGEWNVVGLLVSSPTTAFTFPLSAILANCTYNFMSMDELFALLSHRPPTCLAYANWLEKINSLRRSWSPKEFRFIIIGLYNEEFSRGYLDDGLEIDHNLFFPMWNSDLSSYLENLCARYTVRRETLSKKKKCSIF